MKLSADLAEFRVDVERRFGAVEKDLAGFRSSIETELAIIRKLGAWLLGGVFGLVAALITGAATIGWAASLVNSKVEQQGVRLEKLEAKTDLIENRLNAIDGKLDTLIGRSTPKPGG